MPINKINWWHVAFIVLLGVPVDDVELKIRFGRYIQRTAGIKIFRHPATEPIRG